MPMPMDNLVTIRTICGSMIVLLRRHHTRKRDHTAAYLHSSIEEKKRGEEKRGEESRKEERRREKQHWADRFVGARATEIL